VKRVNNETYIHVKVHCHHGMAHPWVVNRGDGLQIWRVAANILNKQSWTVDSRWSSSSGVGRAANNPPPYNSIFVTKHYTQPRYRMDYLARPKHRKKDLRFGTWNVTSLYRSGSLKMVAREFGKYKLNLEGVQVKGGTEQAEDYTFFYGAGNEDHLLGTEFLYIRESYQQLGQ
jgi:hypothetical protein